MGIVAINDGTILAPGLRFEDDLDTGLYLPAANTLGWVTGGVNRLRHSAAAFAFQESTTISAATGTLTLGAVTLGGAVAGGDYAFTNVGDMTFATGSILASGSTNGNTLLVRANDTTFITLTTGATDVCTLDAITMSGTWLASGTVTLPAITLGGALTVNGQTFAAGAGQVIITTTGEWTGLRVVGTWDTASGVRWTGFVDSATPAASDVLLSVMARGRDSATNEQEFGEIRLLIEDPTSTSEAGKLEVHLFAAGADNDALHLSSTGVLDVDASSGLGAATVGLFDDYDDAILLRQGISERQLEVLEKIGVMKRKSTGSKWMVNIQAMLYLLAGGVYQTRARMDGMMQSVNSRLSKLESALPDGRG